MNAIFVSNMDTFNFIIVSKNLSKDTLLSLDLILSKYGHFQLYNIFYIYAKNTLLSLDLIRNINLIIFFCHVYQEIVNYLDH